MKVISYSIPARVENLKTHYEIKFNVQSKSDPETQRQFFEFDCVKVSDLNYDTIVSAVIKSKYSQDKEFALTNNYACEGTSPEWEEYQADRAHAKAIAKTILGAE